MLGGAGESLALNTKTDDMQVQQWVVGRLLPWAYWHQQADKTQKSELLRAYQAAASQAEDRLRKDPLTQQLDPVVCQQWVEWAHWIGAKYQRTSSAVEGRNGYLSRLHHTSRGLDAQTLAVLTVIHNFDIRRGDGTTAMPSGCMAKTPQASPAQRLFGHYAREPI